MLDFMVRAKAATKLRTSTVALTDGELRSYKQSVLDYYYPELKITNYPVYAYLADIGGYGNPDDRLNPYEWWLNTPLGPKSCNRDIADLRSSLREWYAQHQEYGRLNRVMVTEGDEWDEDLGRGLLIYQKFYPVLLMVTGYADAETLRRLRLNE